MIYPNFYVETGCAVQCRFCVAARLGRGSDACAWRAVEGYASCAANWMAGREVYVMSLLRKLHLKGLQLPALW